MLEEILFLKDSNIIKAGSLCKFKDKQLISIDDKNISLEIFPKSDYKSISDEEFCVLKTKSINKRVEKSNKFYQSRNLIINQEVYIKDSLLIWTVINKTVDKGKIFYQIQSSKKETKYIEALEITKVLNISSNKLINVYDKAVFELSNQILLPTKKFSSLRRRETIDTSPKFVCDIYLHKNTSLGKRSILSDKDPFHTRDLIQINNSETFGRIHCFLSLFHINLVCISINETISKNLNDILEEIQFSNNYSLTDFNGIIIKLSALKKFNYCLISTANGPNIDTACIKFKEKYISSKFNPGDFVKHIENEILLYAKVIESLLVNNEACSVITTVFPREKSNLSNQLVKESEIEKVENFKKETKFFEGVIIVPYSILTIEMSQIGKFKINDVVSFVLRDSYVKLRGNIRWIGKLNEIPVAILNLVNNSNDHTYDRYKIDRFLCPFFYNLRFNKSSQLFAVPLSCLKKKKDKEYIDIIKGLLDDSDNGFEIVMNKALNMKNERVLPLIIENTQTQIELERYPTLLQILFERQQFETMIKLLQKSIPNKNVDLVLLNFALKAFHLENKDIFLLLVQKCTNRNRLLDNGETFLTYLLRENISEKEIIQIVQFDLFDINIKNLKEESPLLLSCEKLYVKLIQQFMKCSLLHSSQINVARQNVLKLFDKENFKTEEKQKIISIVKLLIEKQSPENICNICEDKKIDEVFLCGHATCKLCSQLISECPFCRKNILGRNPIFL